MMNRQEEVLVEMNVVCIILRGVAFLAKLLQRELPKFCNLKSQLPKK